MGETSPLAYMVGAFRPGWLGILWREKGTLRGCLLETFPRRGRSGE
jgi:hypothetical protein